MEKATSLVIPTVNEGENLSMTIQSLLETTTGTYEILIIDNGSTDGSTDFITHLDDPRLRLLKTGARLGVAGARNYGAAFVESEILIFIDAHMLFPANWLPPVLDVLQNESVGIVVPAVSAWGNPYAIGYGMNWLDERLEPKWQSKLSADPYPVPLAGGCFQALRRDFFYEIGGFDTGMRNFGSEDVEICLRTWLLGSQVMLIPQVEISHRFRRSAPYPFAWSDTSYNLLRLIYTHLNEQRIERVISLHTETPSFVESLECVKNSDIWFRRRVLAEKRKYDDDWFFRNFDIKN